MDLKRLKLKPHKLFHHLDEVTKWQKGEYFPPIYVEFNAIDACNQRCHFCYSSYLKHTNLKTEDDLLLRIFSELGAANVKSVQLQGTGEPLLHKAVPDAIVLGKRAGLDIAVSTNGVLLTNDVIEKILPCISWVRISSIECKPDLYARTHGCEEWHWQKVISNLKAAVEFRNRNKLDVVIGAQFIVFEYNAPYIIDTLRMCRDEIGVDSILVKTAGVSPHNPTHNWTNDSHIKYAKLFKEAEELKRDDFVISMRPADTHGTSFTKDYEACYSMYFETQIDANAKVYPCPFFWRNEDYCLGDLSKMSFEELWKSEQRKNVIDRIHQEWDLDNCTFKCKNHYINGPLWELANPPMHKNFL